jgi:hypothetical protein
MGTKDYSHRRVVDKLGIKAGHRVALIEMAGPLDPGLRRDVLERCGDTKEDPTGDLDVVLVTVAAGTDAVDVLQTWRAQLDPAGGIWLLTPKRGLPGYVDQAELIPAGQAAGMVDNKTCSVSDTTSAMRFVVRRRDRPPRA